MVISGVRSPYRFDFARLPDDPPLLNALDAAAACLSDKLRRLDMAALEAAGLRARGLRGYYGRPRERLKRLIGLGLNAAISLAPFVTLYGQRP